MDKYQSMARKYKKGKSYQWSIPLKKGHPFDDMEEVVIVSGEDLEKLEQEAEELREANQKLVIDASDNLKSLIVAKEVINQYKDVMKTQETIIAIYTERGIIGRLRNRKPKETDQLQEEKVKLVQLEDATIPVIELPQVEDDQDKKGRVVGGDGDAER